MSTPSNIQAVSAPIAVEERLALNLQQLLHKQSISETELARRTGLPQPTIHKVVSGKTEDPRISTLQVLAAYFKVSVDDLFSPNVLLANHASKVEAKSIPVISWEECLRGESLIKTMAPDTWNQWIVVNGKGGELYAVSTKLSMEPCFPRGTLLAVTPNVAPTDGALAVVHYPNTQEATLREVWIDGPNQLLEPINHNGPADKLDDSIRIIGIVTQSQHLR